MNWKRRHPWNRSKRAFTMTELLVVVGIMAALLAIAVPALRGVQQRNRKLTEAQNIRQVFLAWNIYGNFNRDATLPGYLDHDSGLATQNVHEVWRVHFDYPIPPDPDEPNNRTIPHDIAAPWTWRLMPYLDYSLPTIWRYRNLSSDLNAMAAIARQNDPTAEFVDVDDLMRTIAEEPEFAYNAFHVGGWWEMTDPSASGNFTPMPRFHDAIEIDPDSGVPSGVTVDVISRSLPRLRRAAEVIVFSTATSYMQAGEQPYRGELQPGSHVVTPPYLADVPRWSSAVDSGGYHIPHLLETHNEILTDDPVYAPFGRYNRLVTVIHADGSTEATMPMNLDTPRRWIDAAVSETFRFQEPGP